MTRVKFSDGTELVVDNDKLRTFFIENGTPINDYLEFLVRKKLGQTLNNYADFVIFKKEIKENSEADRPEHLRFSMTGQRDGEGGLSENIEIFKLFDLPISVRSSQDYEDYDPSEYGNIFIFHKGTPILYQRKGNGLLVEVEQYGGWGTVEILVMLIKKFNLNRFFQQEIAVL